MAVELFDGTMAAGIAAGAVAGIALAAWGTRSALQRDHSTDWLQLKQLAADGLNLEKPREIEFVLFVRTPASAEFLISQLATQTFSASFQQGQIEVTPAHSPQESFVEDVIIISARKTIPLYGNNLRRIRLQLSAMAEKENGQYLGWQVMDRSI